LRCVLHARKSFLPDALVRRVCAAVCTAEQCIALWLHGVRKAQAGKVASISAGSREFYLGGSGTERKGFDRALLEDPPRMSLWRQSPGRETVVLIRIRQQIPKKNMLRHQGAGVWSLPQGSSVNEEVTKLANHTQGEDK